jgi:cardiolipin synthase
VRVLVDGGGNMLQGEPKGATASELNRTVCWLASQPHVELLRTRNPYSRFDHRKLVVADGRVAWSGGRNFTQSAFFTAHDFTYTLAGPLAGQIAELFEEFWRDQGGTPCGPLPPSPPPADANSAARVVRTRVTQRQLQQSVYLAVERARHHVYVENPYFSDSRLQLLLAEARRRGADVRAVMTLADDSEAVNHANRVVANRLLRAGVRVYVYPGTTHAKALAVDGVWAYAGSGNFDPLSFRHNRELGLAIGGGPIIAEMEDRLFRADFRPEWELTEPLTVTAFDHLLDFLAGTFF